MRNNDAPTGNLAVGGFPSLSAGLSLRHFAATVSGMNLDLIGNFSAEFNYAGQGRAGGVLGAGIAEIMLAVAPRSTPISLGAGLHTGVGGLKQDGRSAAGLLLGVGLEALLHFGEQRNYGVGLRLRGGGFTRDDAGGYTAWHLLFECGL